MTADEIEETDVIDVVAETDGEDLAVNRVGDITRVSRETRSTRNQSFALRYIFVPFIFLTVALLGGLRLAGIDSSFIFLKPPLLCLIFASITVALFFRSGLIRTNGWFAEEFPLLK